MLLTLAYFTLILYSIYFVFCKRDPIPVCGVYREPGKWFWLKYGIFRLLYKLRKHQNEKKQKTGKETAGYGVKSKDSVNEMEKVQKLSHLHPKAVDAVYFNASDSSDTYLIAATARRHNNVVQTVFMLHLPGVGLLELAQTPDTTIINNKTHSSEYSAGGLKLKPVTPMKTWKLTFEGEMKMAATERKVNVVMDAEWRSCTEYFDADTDMDEHALSVAIARESWSRAFFDRLKSSHQTHYEQFGNLVGTVKVDDKVHKLKLKGVRDHSYGNEREWKIFHRYALHFVHLEDGTCFNVGVISMPDGSMSRMEFGYVFTKNGQKAALQWCDMDLPRLGEDWTDIPQTYDFKFKAGETVYHVECEVLRRPVFYLGDEWEAKVYEMMSRYVVNGVKGYGFSEWEYKNTGGKLQN